MKITYEIVGYYEGITCLLCGLTSRNLNDIAYRYCGRCHVFHEEHEEKLEPPPNQGDRR